jgi:capsular exopolysaccharide synthesis family protein
MRLQAAGGRLNKNGNGNGNGHGNGNGNGHANGYASPELLLSASAPAPLTEAYRQLRTSMLLAPWPGELKSLLVTSSAPGEGKTTMAVNTAISLSRTGALVLLIDADLRKPRLHTVFHLENESGLSTILADDVEESAALRAVVHDDHSGIDVLTSGPTQPESAELLASEHMQRIVTAFRSVYDYVVIDSPPLAYFSDGAMISSLVDGVVLVVNSGHSSREMMRQSCQLLQGAGANICGVVLNNVKGSGYDYRQYYDRA